MKPPAFDYALAGSIDEAVQKLSDGGDDARVIAGGQTLLPMLALRLARPSLLIDINRIADLKGAVAGQDGLRVRSMTRQAEILRDPLVAEHATALSRATAFVGHYHTRNRGTIGGSVATADPASEYPAVVTALGANIEATSKGGTRSIPAHEFFQGPYVTALQPEEMITAIHFPAWGKGTVTEVEEVMRRPGDFGLVGFVLTVQFTAGKVERAGMAWMGMGPTPMRATAAEKALVGLRIGEIKAADIAQLALTETEAGDDLHASADYRRKVGASIAARALSNALEQGKKAA